MHVGVLLVVIVWVTRADRGVCMCAMRGRHGTKLYVHINKSDKPVSAMFEVIERVKEQLNIMEYSLSQTSLEQVSTEACVCTVSM